MIDAKLKGIGREAAEGGAPESNVTDLMAALKKSREAAAAITVPPP